MLDAVRVAVSDFSRRRSFLAAFSVTLPVVALAAFVVYVKTGYPLIGIDDADITFVYAHNLLAHGAFTYQPFGERVEGFSSMLWTLIAAGAFAFSAHPLWLLFVIEVVLIAAALAYLIRFIWREEAFVRFRGVTTVFVLLWTFSITSYAFWVGPSLMEFALWSALLISLSVFVLSLTRASLTRGKQCTLVVLFAALVLTRPESFAYGLIFLGLIALVEYAKQPRLRATLRALLPSTLVFLATIAALTAFRLSYFGYPLPNTYYQKVSPDFWYRISQGLYYLAKFLYWYPGAVLTILAMTALAYLACQRVDRTLRIQSVVLTVLLLASFSLPVWEGGDHFIEARLFLPFWPLFALPFLYLAALVRERHTRGERPWDSRFLRVCAFLGALVVFFYLPPYKWYERPEQYSIFKDISLAEQGQKMGTFLNDYFSGAALPTVGIGAAGGIALTYRGPIVDLLGLNDIAMAHQQNNARYGLQGHAAFDPATFFAEQHPNLLLPVVTNASSSLAVLEDSFSYANDNSLRGLLTMPMFQERYMPAISKNPSTNQRLFAYFSRSYLAELESRGYVIVESDTRYSAHSQQ